MIKFNNIVIITSMLIAGCAAYFSVYGLGLLFSGAMIAAMIMASALELGKLVTTTWLFKNWIKSNFIMKFYMISAIVLLMGITSLGIFGFLTSAFQKSSLETELSNTKIKTYELQKTELIKNIDNSNHSIEKLYVLRSSQESRLNETLTNTLIARNPIQLQNIQNQIGEQIDNISKQLESENNKIKQYNDKTSSIDEQIHNLKVENIQKKDITTFKFVADEFNTTIQSTVKWLIIVLITVFDPLAIVLLIAYNISSRDIPVVQNIPKILKDDGDDVESEEQIKEEIQLPLSKPENTAPILDNNVTPSITEPIIPEEPKKKKKKDGIRRMFSF